jgi:hypothetical protein
MAKLSFSVGVRLDPDVHQALREEAAAQGRSLSSHIAWLCSNHVTARSIAGQEPVTDWMEGKPQRRRPSRAKTERQ